MRTVEAIVVSGRVRTPKPLEVSDHTRCLVTILEQDLKSLRADARARLEQPKQRRLRWLLRENKRRSLSAGEERELDRLLADVHELMARKAEAALVLDQFRKKR
jgi:hypothetical protein